MYFHGFKSIITLYFGAPHMIFTAILGTTKNFQFRLPRACEVRWIFLFIISVLLVLVLFGVAVYYYTFIIFIYLSVQHVILNQPARLIN